MDRHVILVVVLLIHLVAAIVHGVTHELVPVVLDPELNVIILATVFIGPFLGVALDWRGSKLGIPLFTVSMATAFLLGGALHFLIDNPDHIRNIPHNQWAFLFQLSAAGVLLTPGVGGILGAWYLRTEK